jgi:hypothetical protein
MSRVAIEQLLLLMDEAFRDHPFHALLNNLKSLREDDWDWLAPDGVRTVRHIVEHVGGYKYLYDNQAFGDRSLTWDRLFLARGSAPDAVTAWLRDGHEKLRSSVASLADDEELTKGRMAPWGSEANTRWIVTNMVQHDIYHAGEINYIRGLHQKNDGGP